MSRRLTQIKAGPSGTQRSSQALPAYEPPILPLHGTALEIITDKIPRTHNTVESQITAALKILTSVASDLGERTTKRDDPKRAEKQKFLDALEQAARATVDASMKLQDSKEILAKIGTVETRRHEVGAQARRGRARARRAAANADSGDEVEGEGEDKVEPVGVDESLWSRYKAAYTEKGESYEKKSDREKYGDVKEYANFRRTLWDAQNPDVPMPPVRQWFGPATGEAAEEDSDDELEVAQERISYQCPLTLVEFVNPVTTRVCKHSFEKEAIFEMLHNQRGKLDCPVAGCSQKLTAKDLVEDEYLLGKMRRHQERKERERRQAQMEEVEEEDEDEEEREKPVTREEMKKVKKEKGAKTSAPTARHRGRQQVMDLEDEDEEMED
ncbi:zinc-finger of the MIZ type in Nse subunit-domain-containing protein [Trichophaea hybrida]|nr:zinc-finger of the MIZ type in Nse subunit-domain-containing protein [Trichophaea hybrida]